MLKHIVKRIRTPNDDDFADLAGKPVVPGTSDYPRDTQAGDIQSIFAEISKILFSNN